MTMRTDNMNLSAPQKKGMAMAKKHPAAAPSSVHAGPISHPQHPAVVGQAAYNGMRALAQSGAQQVVSSPEDVFNLQQNNYSNAPILPPRR